MIHLLLIASLSASALETLPLPPLPTMAVFKQGLAEAPAVLTPVGSLAQGCLPHVRWTS